MKSNEIKNEIKNLLANVHDFFYNRNNQESFNILSSPEKQQGVTTIGRACYLADSLKLFSYH